MKEIFGWNEIKKLAQEIKRCDAKKVLLINSKSAYYNTCAKEEFEKLQLPFVQFSGFKTNPHIEDIERAVTIYRKAQCDIVVGLGGGTAMDIAKVVSMLAPLKHPVSDYVQKKRLLINRTVPLILIPTTAGTGSEATHFAVVYINKQKHSLAHTSLLPDVAIVDPSLTLSVPSYVTACTGMDALSHAIESYWSVRATKKSQYYCQQAIPLILGHLQEAVNKNTKKARVAMAKASNLAGKAINISFTTAAHAMSYSMTSYFNVPHGLACALTLPSLLVFNTQLAENSQLNEERGIRYLKKTINELIKLLSCKNAKQAEDKLKSLMRDCNLPTT